MSFTENYLKLRNQRTKEPNTGAPAKPDIETIDLSASGGDAFTSKYLELRKKRTGEALPRVTQSKSPADVLDKMVTDSVRNTTARGYYARPDFGSRSEELYSNVASLEPAFKEARTALETAQAGAQEAEANLKFWQEHVSLLKDAYTAVPSQANAEQYNKAYASYAKLYDAYSKAHSAYSAAYDMYKPLEDQINQAIKEYQAYSNFQQTQFKEWRSTIRQPEEVKQELDAVNDQLKELEKQRTSYAVNSALAAQGRLPGGLTAEDPNVKIGQLERTRALLEEEYDWSRYYQYAGLMENEDFAQKSQYASTANGLQTELHPLSGLYTETGFDDLTYDYINRNKDAYGKALVNGIADNTALLGLDTSYLKQMSNDEIAIFNYLYATQGADAAYQYTAYLTADLNARQRRENEAYWAKYAEEHPVKASAFSVLMSPMKGLSYLGQAADYADDGKIDQNAAYNKFSYTNSAIRNQVTKEIQKNEQWGEIGRFAYQTGMSMADFLMATALTGNNQAITLAVMGSGAAADTTIAAKDRGLSDDQAFALGTIAGIAEAAMESFNMETVFDPKLFQDGLLKYILKNAASEGLEEVGTDIVNLFADILIAKDQSQWQQSIDAYIKQGKSQAEAIGMALADQAAQMGADFLGGAVSGGILSGTTAGIHVNHTNNLGKDLGGLNMSAEDVQAFIDTGLESDPQTEAYQVAKKMQAKLDAGKKLSNYDLATLYQANVQAVAAEQEKTDIGNDEPQGLSLPTLENDTDPAAVGTVKPGNVTQNPAFVTQNQVNGTPSAAANVGETISVAQRLRQEQNLNGGIQNVNINERAGQPAAADLAARGIAQSGTNLPDGIQQRNVGSRAGEQTGSLAGRTIRDAATVDWRRATVDRQNRIGHLRLEKVSSIDLGLQSGTETKNVQVVPQEHWDTDMTQLADRIREETEKNVTFVMGQIQVRSGERGVSYVNGVFTGDRIIVRADNVRMPMEKIADHEAYHAKTHETDRLLNREIRRHIIETFSEEQFRMVMEKYVIALRGVYSVEDVRTGDEYESLMRQIEEEVFADAYAGINAFGAGADQFTEAVNLKMDELRVGKLRKQDNGVRETAGPPTERYSITEISGENLDYGNGVILDSQIFDNVKPRDWGKRLSDYVYNNLAGAELTVFDDAGNSEVIHLAKSNDRVRKEGTNGSHKVLDKLARYRGDNIKALATVHLSELLATSRYEKSTDEHTHQWMDENGWELRKTYIQDRNGNIYEAILNIANGRDRRILYAISNVRRVDKKRVARGDVPSTNNGGGSLTRSNSSHQILADNGDGVKNEVKERSFPKITGSSTNGGALNGKTSFEKMVPQKEGNVKTESDEEFLDRYGLKLPSLPEETGTKTVEKFSVDDADQNYMDAVNRGDMETAQQMVDQAARDAGYNSPILYHGTKSFGFTEFDLSKMDDKRTIFLTDNERIAASYSGVMGKRNASSGNARSVDDLSLQEVVDELNSEQFGVGAEEDDQYRYSYLSLKNVNNLITSVNDRVEEMQDEVAQKIQEYADKMAADFDDKDQKVHRNLVNLSDQLQKYQYDKISTSLYMLLHHTEVFNDSVETAERIANLERDIRLMNRLKSRDNSEGVIIESWLNGYSLTALDEKQARDRLEVKRKTGNYGLYARLKNPLEIDAKGTVWNDIRHWYRYININMGNTRVERRGEEYLLINQSTGEEIPEGGFAVNVYTSGLSANQRHSYMVDKALSSLSIITENMNTTREIAEFAQKLGYDGVIFRNLRDNGGRNAFIGAEELADIYTLFDPAQAKSADPVTYDDQGNVIPLSKRFSEETKDIRYSVDDSGTEDPLVENDQKQEDKKRNVKPVAESKPIIAKRELRSTLLGFFSIPDGQRAELGNMIDGYADRLIKNGQLTEDDRKIFFDKMYNSGVMVMPADEIYSYGRDYLKNGRIYVSDSLRSEFGDDWNDVRKRAFAAGVYLTNDRNDAGTDVWNAEMSDLLPGLFDSEETDQRSILERIIHVAEEGKGERMSLPEYTAQLAGIQNQSEADFLDAMERQMDYALRAFAEKASLEIYLRDRTGVKIAQEREKGSQRLTRERAREAQRRADERERRQDMTRRQRERKELQELQKKTMKQLQWLSKNRNRAPEELKAAWDDVLGDIDLYAIGAANEMRWSDKHNATWRDLAQMYKDAMQNDPNFLPSKELERIVARLDGTKIGDMDIGALQDLYKAAIGLRTEFYNRNNVINDEMNRLFAEVYTDAKREIEAAPSGFTGNVVDKFVNLDQLTPMNVLQRMGGWDPNGAFYSMAKQLERGERDMRAYSVKAQRMLRDFLTEREAWVKRADGQGKDAIWYEVEVPQMLELGMGDKPIFGPTVKVYMTPAQKVHMYLESKNVDNLRHMTGGRTFVNKELYSKGKRQEALSQGKTVRLAPETVKQLVSDLTAEEMELAQILERYYNTFATQEINRISNILYGYDKAMGKNYAPIYTNRNYTKTEFGVFDTTAEGVGNLKGRQYAVNPSYNISALDAFERHVDQTARFVGMAIPARNWTTLMNWREKNNSTGDVITHKWGEESKRYITDLITKLQSGDDSKSDTISAGISKLQSNYISAIFGANPSIVLKQLGSIPLAGAYLDARNVPKLAQVAGINRELIGKYTQDLEWRTMGYSTPETKQLKDNPNWTQTNKTVKFIFGGGAITAVDGWAASVLWPWAENKVRREHPELAVGTEAEINNGESAFYKKVAEEFENALSRSQSVSDEIHQGSLRKSKNPITRAFTLFRSDSAQTYNALRQKIGEARYYARTGAKENVLRSAKKAAGSVFVAMILNAAWAEAINFLMAMWKNKGKNYRDDEDELTFGSVAGEMVAGMLGSFSGVVTGGEEAFEVIGNIITGDTWYGIDTPGMEQLNDMVGVLVESGTGLRDLVAGAADILSNGGDLGEYFSKHSGDMLGSIKDLAQAAAVYLPGFPAENIEAYLLGALKWISPELGTAYDALFSNMGKSDLSGLEGGALETRIGGILSKRRISESDETVQALAELYAAEYKEAIPSDTPSSIEINDEKQTLGAYQQQVYDTVWSDIVSGVLDDMVASRSFQSAEPEGRAKMLKSLYSYAAEKAKEELFDDYEIKSSAAKIDRLKARGISLMDYVTLQGMIPAYDANNNNSYSNSEVQAAIEGVLPGLSAEKKAALWQEVTGTTSAKNNPYSQEVGQDVLDGKSKPKSSATIEPEDEDITFEEAILRQWAGN